MPNFICSTCGTQFSETAQPPVACAICHDERQYVKVTGQQWTTTEQMALGFRNSMRQEEPGLIALGVEPQFGIGQRAFLIRTSVGNVLWDCLPLLDPALIESIKALGGISAIAISHPHYYASMVDWSRAFGNIPIYVHADDRQWVMRPDPAVVFWGGETRVLNERLTLIRCGGHFEGGAVLHWKDGANGQGTLLSGDTIQVVADRKSVSFMYSYPNYIPLSAEKVHRILAAVEPFPYARISGAFWGLSIDQDGKAIVKHSAQRYLNAIA